MEALLTYDQASKRLNLRVGTLYALVSQGRIPHIRLGKRIVRFSAEALDAWLAENTVGTNAVEKAP
jgi:excisionase family DNA binding protein